MFCAWGDELVRCEVSSNECLAAEHRLDHLGSGTLTSLGWSTPTCERDDDDHGEGSANFYIDVERTEADRLAVMAVKALRDVFGVAHPVFLSSENLAEEDEPAPNLGVPTSRTESGPDPEEPIAVVPNDREHLQALVDDALTPFFGHLPEHDEDDDIPVVSGSGLVFVRVLEHAPAIQMFSALACDVRDLERAGFEVAVLNRDLRFIKFVLVEDRVMAYLYLPVLPFVSQHLRTMLALMAETVDEVDDDLVARIGGRRAFDPTPEDDCSEDEVEEDDCPEDDCPKDEVEDEVEEDEVEEVDESPMHPAMMTLRQLDAESPESVDPELAASICGMDRDLILGLITWNSEPEIAWRQARDEAILAGDPNDEADVCDHEMQHAERTTSLLRQALRIVVERELGRGSGARSYDEPRPGRPGRKRPARPPRESADRSLEELDPDIWN